MSANSKHDTFNFTLIFTLPQTGPTIQFVLNLRLFRFLVEETLRDRKKTHKQGFTQLISFPSLTFVCFYYRVSDVTEGKIPGIFASLLSLLFIGIVKRVFVSTLTRDQRYGPFVCELTGLVYSIDLTPSSQPLSEF